MGTHHALAAAASRTAPEFPSCNRVARNDTVAQSGFSGSYSVSLQRPKFYIRRCVMAGLEIVWRNPDRPHYVRRIPQYQRVRGHLCRFKVTSPQLQSSTRTVQEPERNHSGVTDSVS